MSSPIHRSEVNPRRKRVLVAGATGYLGGFVVRELHARGYTLEDHFRQLGAEP